MKNLILLLIILVSITSCSTRTEQTPITHTKEWVMFSGKFESINDSIAIIRVHGRKIGPIATMWKLSKSDNKYHRVR